jgi:hypothetical protein
MRDRGRSRGRLEGPDTAEPHALHAGSRQPNDRSLTPDPWRPSQPARRLELRDMPPNHTLIQIQPSLHRWYGHDSQPPDEPSHRQSAWTWNNLLANHDPTT